MPDRGGSARARCARVRNPPQWRLSFTLDETRYIALVVITDDAPRMTPAT
jgi:hypothetical protein